MRTNERAREREIEKRLTILTNLLLIAELHVLLVGWLNGVFEEEREEGKRVVCVCGCCTRKVEREKKGL